MARNAEKAMTTLARWRAAKETEAGKNERRPFLASECRELPKCEKWRLEIIREISKKVIILGTSQSLNFWNPSIASNAVNLNITVAQIQNAGLGEFRIRDLNDEINKLLREKRHWENQISDLGGPHYRRYGPKMFDADGREVPGNRGYKYFGAAKDLPGVRELFEQEPLPVPRKTRTELMKDVDADYYGYRDDDDGLLKPLEEIEERLAIKNFITQYQNKGKEVADEEENIYETMAEEEVAAIEDDNPMGLLGPKLVGHEVPSQKEIEAALLKKKKDDLLEKYGLLET